MNKDRRAYSVIVLISSTVFVFLFWLIYFKNVTPSSSPWVSFLPAINAVLNTITSLLLVLGFVFIKKGNKEAHIRVMLGAVLTSALFLISYIIYHYYQGDSKFMGAGNVRYVYFSILISHVLLSMAQVPLIFTTLYFAFSKNFEKHRKFARITFPIWLYVSITGVMVFSFLKIYK